jgi:ATP-binding cassette, subfamily B, bacterial PglK
MRTLFPELRKVLELFSHQSPWKLVGLFGLIVLMAFVQVVGVASILPFMNLVADPGEIERNRLLGWLYETLGFESTRSFLIFTGFVVLGLTAFSNAFSAVTNWVMLRFIWNQQYQLSVRLLTRYLQEPYPFFLNRNSGGLAKNILAEVKEAINGFVMPVMKALAQVVVAAAIIALLVWVDPLLALVAVTVLGGAYSTLYLVVRRRQARLGGARLAANEARFRAAGEAFGGIKEMKVLAREAELLKRFSRPAREYSRVNTANAVISEIPRYALETLAFGGILAILLYILGTQEDIGQAVAIMSLYALAGYRLLPALQQIFAGFAKARFFSAALNNFHSELVGSGVPVRGPARALPGRADEPLPFAREIRVRRVTFSYPGSDEVTLRDVDLTIPKNTTVGLAGSTGSGKTTLVDLLLGLLEPTSGRIEVDGVPLSPDNHARWRRKLGYVPQHIYLLDDSVTRNIAFGQRDDQIDREAVERAARIALLHEFVETLPQGYDTVVGERGIRLSGGQRQRIGIARALYHDPDVLVMDEATSALDGITEVAVIQAIRELASRKTIILVAHRLASLRGCDVIHLFEEGRVVASGTHAELMRDNVRFRAMARGLSAADGRAEMRVGGGGGA